MGYKRWSKEEELFLEEKWGIISIPAIARRLNRTEKAVINKKNKMGLGCFLESGDYVILNQLLTAVGYTGGHNYHHKSWIKNRGLPAHKKRVQKRCFWVVKIQDFWKWAEKNKDFLNFANFEEGALGAEPEWVKEHRKRCFYNYKKSKWSSYEVGRLTYMLKEHKYTYEDIAKELNRSSGAILRRILDLGLKERPIRASIKVKWTDEEKEQLRTMIQNGCGYKDLSTALGKSDKAVRGKVYGIYKTENIDKVRQIIEDMEGQESG